MASPVTTEQVLAAVQRDDNTGICLACGEEFPGDYEPDARNDECDACGAEQVFGAEECLIHLA